MAHLAGQSVSPGQFGEGQSNRYRARILISGNHHDTRYMMRVLLEMWGFEVVESAGANETVKIAESEHPQLILVDTATQFNEDLKIVSELRHSRIPASIPIIVLSGYPQADYQKAAFENGATGRS